MDVLALDDRHFPIPCQHTYLDARIDTYPWTVVAMAMVTNPQTINELLLKTIPNFISRDKANKYKTGNFVLRLHFPCGLGGSGNEVE